MFGGGFDFVVCEFVLNVGFGCMMLVVFDFRLSLWWFIAGLCCFIIGGLGVAMF